MVDETTNRFGVPAGGGRLALTESKAMMRAASATIGNPVDVELTALE